MELSTGTFLYRTPLLHVYGLLSFFFISLQHSWLSLKMKLIDVPSVLGLLVRVLLGWQSSEGFSPYLLKRAKNGCFFLMCPTSHLCEKCAALELPTLLLQTCCDEKDRASPWYWRSNLCAWLQNKLQVWILTPHMWGRLRRFPHPHPNSVYPIHPIHCRETKQLTYIRTWNRPTGWI